jgi:hypothetical protein
MIVANVYHNLLECNQAWYALLLQEDKKKRQNMSPTKRKIPINCTIYEGLTFWKKKEIYVVTRYI